MADRSDGSLVFDTELDNTNFDKGAKKLLAAVEDLTGAVDNLGDNMMHSFQTVIPLLQNIAGSASQIYDRMAAGGQQAAAANQQVTDSSQQVAAAVQQTVQAVQNQGQAVDSLGRQTNNLQQQVAQNAGNATQAMQQQATAAKGVSEAIGNAQKGTSAAGQSMDAYETKIAKTQAKIDVLKAKLADYYTAVDKIQNPAPEEDWLRGVNDEEQIANALKVEELAVEALNRKYADKLTVLKNLEGELARLKTLQQEAAAAPKEIADSAAVKSFASEIGKTETKLNSYQAKVEKMQTMGAKSSAWKNIQYDIDATKAKLDQYKAKLDQLNASGGISTESYEKLSETLSRLTETQSNLSSLTSSMLQTSNAGSRVNAFLGGFGSAMKSAAHGAVSLAKNMVKVPFVAMKNGAKSVISKLKEFTAHSKNAELTSKGLVKSLTRLKTIMVSRIKEMFVTAIFNQTKEALNSLSKFSSTFNQAMSNLKNNATQLSANMAVSLGNLITAIEPILTKIISALSTAISYLNAFFAMLSGKNTMIVAKKQTASYADSLDKAGSAAKELKTQLMGFDEIERMNEDTSSSGSGSTGTGGDLFEEIPIDSVLPAQVQAYFDRLKAAIQAGDWEGVGRIIAEGLNSGMKVVDNWINTVLRPMGVLWAGRVAEILNGLTDGFDWNLFGKTLADGMNAAFDILNTFLTTYDFERLGSGIGDAICSWFYNVDWALIGQTFANKWNALISVIHGIVTTPGIWQQIGTSVGTFINNLFLTLDYEKAAETLVAGFNGIFATLQRISDIVDWSSIAQNIYNGLNTMIHGIDWVAAGTALSDAVVNLLGVFRDVAANTDWYGLGQGIGNFLSSIDWVTIIGEVGTILWDAFSGMLAGLFSTSGGKVIAGFGAGLLAIKGVFAVGKFALSSAVLNWVLGGTGQFAALTSAASGLVSGLGSILGTIGSVIFSPTGLIIAGIAAGVVLIATHWDQIKDAAGKLKDALSEKWSQIKDAASNLWQNVKDTVSTKFTQAKDSVVQTASNIRTRLSDTWSNVKTTASSMWDSVKTTVTSKFDQAKNALSQTGQSMQSTLSQKFSGILSDSTRKFESLRSTLDRASQNSNSAVVRNFASMASNMISNMSNAARSIQNQGWSGVGQNICSGIQSGINRGWSWLSSTVSNLASSLLRSAKSALGIHSPSRLFRDEVGENIGLGWAEGIEGTEATVLKTVANVAKGITANAETEMPDIQYSGDSMLSGLDAVANKLSEVAAIFQNIGNMIAAAGGLIVPQISAGTVVPYKTRVDGGNGKDDPDTTPGGSQMDLIDALQQMFEAVIQAIEDKDMDVVIGDDEIWSANNRHNKKLSIIKGVT